MQVWVVQLPSTHVSHGLANRPSNHNELYRSLSERPELVHQWSEALEHGESIEHTVSVAVCLKAGRMISNCDVQLAASHTPLKPNLTGTVCHNPYLVSVAVATLRQLIAEAQSMPI